MLASQRFHKFISVLLVCATLSGLLGLGNHHSVLATSYGTPWYEVQIAGTSYTVNLDTIPGSSITGPLQESLHSSILNHVYVIEDATGQPMADQAIREQAALLAQNRAITSHSSHWQDWLGHDNEATFYPSLVDSEGNVFRAVLPSSVSDFYAQTLISGRFGTNLRNFEYRKTLYYDVVKAMVFPVLTDEEVTRIESNFNRDLGGIMNDARSSAEIEGIDPGTVEWAAWVASSVNDSAEIALETAGKSNHFVGAFGAFLSGFNLALTGLDVADQFGEVTTESILMTAYLQAMGVERLETLARFTENATVDIDPAFAESISVLSAEVAAIDEIHWDTIFSRWFDEDPVAATMTIFSVVHSVAAIASIFAPAAAPVIAFIGIVYAGIEVINVAWTWLENRNDLVSTAGVAKAVENAIRHDLVQRFATTAPSPADLEQWLLLSNMRLFADFMFYDSLLQRVDWYDDLVWGMWGVDSNEIEGYLDQQSTQRWHAFLQTLPRVYWAYGESEWILNKVASPNSDAQPLLSLPQILPGNRGTSTTDFVFRVTYTDYENHPPASVDVVINSVRHQLSSTDTSYSNGSNYVSDPLNFPQGIHTYYFEASQGIHNVSTNPQNFYVQEATDGHNLSIMWWDISRESAEPGDSVRIQAEVQNRGEFTENFVTADVQVTGPNGYSWSESASLGSLTTTEGWRDTVATWSIPNNAAEGDYSIQLSVSSAGGDEDWSDNTRIGSVYVSTEGPRIYRAYEYRYLQADLNWNPGIPAPTGYAYGPVTTSYGGKTYSVFALDRGGGDEYSIHIEDQYGTEYETFYDGRYDVDEAHYTDANRVLFSVSFVDFRNPPALMVLRVGHPTDAVTLEPEVQSAPVGQGATFALRLTCTSCTYDEGDFELLQGSNEDPPTVYFDRKYDSSDGYYIDGSGLDYTITASPSAAGVDTFVFATEHELNDVRNYFVYGKVEGYHPPDYPPEVTLESPATGVSLTDSIIIRASAVDDKGVNRVEFRANGSLLGTDATPPYEYNWDTATTSDGSKTLEVRAVDSANQSNSDSITVVVDNNGPSISNVNVLPTSPTDADEVEVRATISDASSIAAATLYFSVSEGSSWTPVAMVPAGSTNWSATIPRQDAGQISYYISATDGLAQDASTPTYIFTVVDATPPTFFGWTEIPSNLTEDSTGAFRVQVSTVDVGGSGLANQTAQFDYRVGAAAYDGFEPMTPVSSSSWYFDMPSRDWDALQGQSLYYRVQLSDVAGNVATSSEFNELIDSINDPPEITYFSPLDVSPSVEAGDCLDFSVTAADDDDDTMSYEWRLDNVAVATGASYTYCPADSDAGDHDLIVLVTDGVATVSRSWQITAHGRLEISHTPVSSAIAGNAVPIVVTVTSASSSVEASLYYRISGEIDYSSSGMINSSGNTFEGTIPPGVVTETGVDYYIQATDGTTSVTHPATGNHQIMVAVLGIPILISPPDGGTTTDDTPTFDWNASSGATQYQLQVDDSSNFSSPVIQTTTSNTAYTPSSALEGGTYYWRVRAGDGGGNWSIYSEAWSITVSAADSPIFEDDFSGDQGWIDESGNAFYRDAANEWLFWDVTRVVTRRYYIPIQAQTDIISLSYRFNIAEVGGNGDVWFGLVENMNGGYTDAAMPTGFFAVMNHGGGMDFAYHFISYPDRDPDRPPSGACGWWDCVDPTTWLDLESMNVWRRIDLTINHGAWEMRLYDDSGTLLDSTSGTMSGTHSQYRYLMLFRDSHGGWEWQRGLLDDVQVHGSIADDPPAVPVAVAPTDGSVTADSTPTFDWNASARATQYRLQLDDHVDFSSPTIDITTSNTAFTPSSALADGTYYWRVRAGDEAGAWSDYSSAWAVTVDTPTAPPTLVSPANGSTTADSTPTFDWNNSSGASLYQLQVDSSAGFLNPVIDTTTAGTTHSTTSSLVEGTYYWRVRARDGSGSWSDYSSAWSFTVDTNQGSCHSLTRTRTGSGIVPIASPSNSSGCSAGQYLVGEEIELTAAANSGWHIAGWDGTDDDASTAASNHVTMPGAAHTVSVNYAQDTPDADQHLVFLPFIMREAGADDWACFPNLPTPVLEYSHTEQEGIYNHYYLTVQNRQQFPDELFDPAPNLFPCGTNINASRTWLEIFTGNGVGQYGHCAFESAADLQSFSFPVAQNIAPPSSVYITLNDRYCNNNYVSNTVPIP